MVAQLIDGKGIGQTIKAEIAEEVKELVKQGCKPGLAVILVGDDPASATYVKNKEKATLAAGMTSRLIRLSAETTQEELLSHVRQLNEDNDIHGILVQLPLPKHLDEDEVIRTITPDKDVDGFHPINVGKMVIGQPTYLSCTPYGIIELLERTNVEIAGRHAVVIGRSNIVGKPMGQLLLQRDATVTYCHSRTPNLAEMTKQADILVVAVGRAKMIDASYVKEGAVVIDVGMNRDEQGKLCGDVDFDSVKEVSSAITPVPGGVGPMTITMLLKNTVHSAKRACGIEQ
ncbi:bifunctional methylenetetrahydrofolate dehydrogenase/methenyltetrahydrofolate cyclohydrolase FolD [Savagea sp. SN6]|uniref:Bifunctional protein FolD n=1 Tax=Savagea serpentis TaxID=2785297 RepID=A0A8J7G8S7_9BACL|nr:bifunctional methylenetetrahydrofolate dehydrogenase/methenyltetrahydrofolate cyclohydrolase FolD [Savagea serpentis]MBF4500264.1 bifunctional methylenetetrahydrofolate dehydrogenase/methenyltetrahydrofolate cyclohydrolase FolD [Savagea serpentis]